MDVGSNKSRKDTRAVVSLVARYRSPSTFEYVQEACCDVSVGGMFIKSTDPAAAGTLLKLECEADSNSEKIRGVARVVWLRRDTTEYGPSGMGVKFVKLEPGSRETITRIVQENSAAGIEPQSMSAAPESRGKPPGVHATARSKDNGKSNTSVAQHAVAQPSAPQSPPAPAVAVAPTAVAASSPVAPKAVAVPVAQPHTPIIAAAAVVPEASVSQTFGNASRSSKPEVVAAPPRSAIDTRSVSATAVPAIEPEPKRGGIRISWLIAVAVATLLLYVLTKKDTSIPAETSLSATPTAPTSAAEPSINPAAPPASAAPEIAPAPEGNQPQPEAQPTGAEVRAAPADQPNAPSQAQGAEQEAAKPEPSTQAAKPDEPAAQAPSADVGAPQRNAQAATEAATPAQPAATNVPPSAAEAAATHPPLPPGQLAYIMSFVTRPTGATVTIGMQTVVSPGDMDLGAMPPRVKVTAQKEGFESSSVWLDRETEFVRAGNAMRRRVYLTLPALRAKPATDAPKP